jgi:hypothetical protein
VNPFELKESTTYRETTSSQARNSSGATTSGPQAGSSKWMSSSEEFTSWVHSSNRDSRSKSSSTGATPKGVSETPSSTQIAASPKKKEKEKAYVAMNYSSAGLYDSDSEIGGRKSGCKGCWKFF